MKKNILLLSMVMMLAQITYAQTADYKVVFDMTSKDTVNQQAIIREINIIKGSSPDAQLEVVAYGQGLDLLLKDKSNQASNIEKILGEKKATFKVCALAMQRQHIDKSQLLPGVEVVPDGIYEIVSRQHEGWGYIKVGR